MAGAEYKHSYLHTDPHRIHIKHVHYLMAGAQYPMMLVECDQFGDALSAWTYVEPHIGWKTHDAHLALRSLRNNPDVPIFMRAAIKDYIEKERSARRNLPNAAQRPSPNPSPSDDHDGREGIHDDV